MGQGLTGWRRGKRRAASPILVIGFPLDGGMDERVMIPENHFPGTMSISFRDFEFRAFDQTSFESTRDAWRFDAASGEGFVPDVEQAMAWVEEHLSLTDNEMAYGIFHKDDPVAVGICELAITKVTKAKWVKFIRMRLRPTVEGGIFNHTAEAVATAVQAYVACVLGVFHVKNEHKATTIKVYGRTQEQIQFLTLLSAALQTLENATFTSAIEGRWLVLTWKPS